MCSLLAAIGGSSRKQSEGKQRKCSALFKFIYLFTEAVERRLPGHTLQRQPPPVDVEPKVCCRTRTRTRAARPAVPLAAASPATTPSAPPAAAPVPAIAAATAAASTCAPSTTTSR